MKAINLSEKLATFTEHWQPRSVGEFNGHDLMVVKVKGAFVWHKHDNTDDFFLVLNGRVTDEPAMPSMLDVLTTSMDIVQVRIARSRLAGEPPEVVVAPRLARFRLLDFHRAKEAIEEGHRAVERVAHNLAVLNEQGL